MSEEEATSKQAVPAIVESSENAATPVENKKENNGNNQDLPEELQCEEVDLDSPQMDPLEWSVRKLVSIPKKYYWQTGNYNVSMRTKLWHRTVGTLGLTLRAAERIGEVLANITGLNTSRFDYITNAMTEEEWEFARKNEERSRLKRKERKERQEAEKKKHTIQVV